MHPRTSNTSPGEQSLNFSLYLPNSIYVADISQPTSPESREGDGGLFVDRRIVVRPIHGRSGIDVSEKNGLLAIFRGKIGYIVENVFVTVVAVQVHGRAFIIAKSPTQVEALAEKAIQIRWADEPAEEAAEDHRAAIC
jgi:hypothetical protein